MNYHGSFRHLLRNSKSALLAAVEIYNKPRIEYRDECFVILLLNAWELFLKAMVSKSRGTIFYPKRRKEPYRTLSLDDAFGRAEKLFPPEISRLAVRRNLDLLSTYRDNAVHFYNQIGFGSVIYALAQTSIVNFKDLLLGFFSQNLSDEINWSLLPLGVNPPVDAIEYIAGTAPTAKPPSAAVRQFLRELQSAVTEVNVTGGDSGRVLTVFRLKLESTKKIEQADVLVGVSKAQDTTGPLAVVKTVDPNISHPLRQMDIIQKIGTLRGMPFTTHVFNAVAWKFDLKSKPQFCWRATGGVLTKYSHDCVTWFQNLTKVDVEGALTAYREYLRGRQKRNAR